MRAPKLCLYLSHWGLQWRDLAWKNCRCNLLFCLPFHYRGAAVCRYMCVLEWRSPWWESELSPSELSVPLFWGQHFENTNIALSWLEYDGTSWCGFIGFILVFLVTYLSDYFPWGTPIMAISFLLAFDSFSSTRVPHNELVVNLDLFLFVLPVHSSTEVAPSCHPLSSLGRR